MVCVIGEALIDLVMDPATAAGTGPKGYLAHPGGSPYNVAIGLARLGQPSLMLARLSADAFGRQLHAHAADNGVDLSVAVLAAESSTLAVVSLDADRNASYDFYRTGTADWQWSAAELDRIPAETPWIHTGSLASWTEPGASVIQAKLSRHREAGHSVLSYDPNIRPLLLSDHADAVRRVERMVELSHVVKASAEDLAWLYPGRSVADVLDRWRALGPLALVVTDGGQGAKFVAGDADIAAVPARAVQVVDTVGAGDAFMSGLINALAARLGPAKTPATGGSATESAADSPAAGPAAGLRALGSEAVRPAVAEAILVAALTCARAGANPPTAAELAAAREEQA
jgi:fructokinase